jgi:hypothetical protein
MANGEWRVASGEWRVASGEISYQTIECIEKKDFFLFFKTCPP